MPLTEADKAAKAEIAESQLVPLPAMALTAFAKAVAFEREGDKEATDKWFAKALEVEANALAMA